jgi:hypothetical protein
VMKGLRPHANVILLLGITPPPVRVWWCACVRKRLPLLSYSDCALSPSSAKRAHSTSICTVRCPSTTIRR